MSNEMPRRAYLDKMTPVERAIHDVIGTIETMGCDVRLSRAQIKLAEAKNLVADFVDGVPAHDEPVAVIGETKGKDPKEHKTDFEDCG